MSVRILDLIRCCKDCPHYGYYSGGVYECAKADEKIPHDHDPNTKVMSWCPLPVYPTKEARP